MRLALAEAQRGLGRTHPNPAVGAVIVKAGRVIARGYHAKAGTPHAEAVALARAGAKAKGATIYSTLEPCDHFGRTPPCTQAILDAGIARVVCGSADPNPLVDGKGVRRLRAAGIEVVEHVLRAETDALNRPFLKALATGLPFVTVKLGSTFDGKIATSTGRSKWITSEASRARVHALRDRVDAILVGAGTVVADDPQLTTRLPGCEGRSPVRVVVDAGLSSPLTSRVFDVKQGPRTIVATLAAPGGAKARALEAAGVTVWCFKARGGEVPMRALLRRLRAEELLHVLVEAGPGVTGRLLRAGLVDELWLFIAPRLFGSDGLSWSGALGVTAPARARALRFVSVEPVGDDLLVIAEPT
jgi:diaminohydroxyphosphoribosylaminopyrimidine deaminase/5-amino-6-(5-phosphoribosylamino)uracil reductase